MSFNACSSIAGSWKYHAYSSFEPLSDLQDNQRELIQKIAPCQVRKEVWTDGRTLTSQPNILVSIDRFPFSIAMGAPPPARGGSAIKCLWCYWCFWIMRTFRNKQVFVIEGFDRKFLVILVLCLDPSY